MRPALKPFNLKGRKYLRFVVVFLLLSFQGIFLALVFKEACNRLHTLFVVPVLLLLMIAGLVATYVKVKLHDTEYHHEDFWVTLWVPVGAVACYFLNVNAGLGPVIAAGIVGTAGSYGPSFSKNRVYLKKIPFAIYCGAFVGMCSAGVAASVGFILLAGTLAGLLLLFSKSLFLGVGGKLGLLAFGGVATTAFVFYLLKLPA